MSVRFLNQVVKDNSMKATAEQRLSGEEPVGTASLSPTPYSALSSSEDPSYPPSLLTVKPHFVPLPIISPATKYSKMFQPITKAQSSPMVT